MKMKKGNKWMPNRKSSEAPSRNHSVPSALFPNYLSSNFFPQHLQRAVQLKPSFQLRSFQFSLIHFNSVFYTGEWLTLLTEDSHLLSACMCVSVCVCVGFFGKRQHLLHLSYSPDVTPSASPTRRQRNRIVACCQQQIGLCKNNASFFLALSCLASSVWCNMKKSQLWKFCFWGIMEISLCFLLLNNKDDVYL